MPEALPVIGEIAVNLAVGVGLSVLSGVIAPQHTQASTAAATTGFSSDMTVGQSHPVSAVFGRGVASGNLIYVNSYGTDNEYCQLVIDIGYGEHEGLDTFLVDGVPVTLGGSNSDARGFSVGGKYTVSGTPYLWVKYYTGAAGQVADPQLIAQANPAGRWTSAYKLTGHAYMIVTLRYNADIYSDAFPSFSSVWKGLKLYDWRKDSTVAGGSGSHRWGQPSTYEWTDNLYVIRWNWRRGIYVGNVRVLGLGYPFFAQDVAYYTAAANLADEPIYDPVTDTTFARYSYGREIGDDEDKMSVLSEMDDAGCGTSGKIGGADAPLPAQQQVSVMTLLDTDRIGETAITADRWGLVSAKKTAWSGQYVSPDLGFQKNPYQIRINSDLETLIGGRRTVTVDQPYEMLEARAQMRAEIAARRQSFAGTRTETFGPKAMQLVIGDCVTRSCDWGDIQMIVTRKARTSDRLGVELDLAEWDNTIVPASGETFVTAPDGPGPSPAAPNRMVTVSNPQAFAYPEVGGGATHAAIKFTIDEITDQTVDNWYVTYWPSAGSRADDGKVLTGTRYNTVLVSPPLAPETEYAWQIDISCTPYRATVPTDVAHVTTGDESVPASVPDNSVTVEMLVQELRNRVVAIEDDLQSAVATLQNQIGEQSEYVASVDATSQQQITALTAKNNAATAQIVTIAKAVVTTNSALAELTTTVAAQFNQLSAGGILSWQAQAGTDGVSTSVTMVVTASDGTTQVEAGTYTKIVSDGHGGFTSQTISIADKQYWSDDGGTLSQPMTYDADTGLLTVDQLMVNKVTSPSGKLTIDGTTANSFGEEYIEVTS